MNYYLTERKNIPFTEAVNKITASLTDGGFQVVSEINVSETLKKNLDVNFKEYKILGACDPDITYKAILLEDKIGPLLPCNLIIQEHSENEVEISVINPLESMSNIDNIRLKILAFEVGERLKKILKNI